MEKFDKIFKKYYHILFLYALKFVDNDTDAHDIVQEVFAAVWENEKYLLENSHLKSYLFKSVRNGCLNFLKHQSIIRKHVEDTQQLININEINLYLGSEKSFIEKEDLKKIYQAIDSLSPNYKEVIQLSRLEGLKNKQIADKLNIPVRTVETRLFRALNKLRETLSSKQILVLFQLSAIRSTLPVF